MRRSSGPSAATWNFISPKPCAPSLTACVSTCSRVGLRHVVAVEPGEPARRGGLQRLTCSSAAPRVSRLAFVDARAVEMREVGRPAAAADGSAGRRPATPHSPCCGAGRVQRADATPAAAIPRKLRRVNMDASFHRYAVARSAYARVIGMGVRRHQQTGFLVRRHQLVQAGDARPCIDQKASGGASASNRALDGGKVTVCQAGFSRSASATASPSCADRW